MGTDVECISERRHCFQQRHDDIGSKYHTHSLFLLSAFLFLFLTSAFLSLFLSSAFLSLSLFHLYFFLSFFHLHFSFSFFYLKFLCMYVRMSLYLYSINCVCISINAFLSVCIFDYVFLFDGSLITTFYLSFLAFL